MTNIELWAGAAAGRFQPENPTIIHGPSTGQFVISNYNAQYQYQISTGTRSGNTISLDTSQIVSTNVTAASPKGGPPYSGSSFIERRPYTYSWGKTGEEPGSGECSYLPNCADCGNCPQCANCGAGSGGLCIYCPGPVPTYGWIKDSTPPGFTDSFGEWWRIS